MALDKGKRKKARLRLWFQAAWFALTNGYAAGFLQGKIYRGRSKAVCVPGLNCYSCPGALGACPIGALQSVLGSSGFRISCYVFGFLLLFGTLMGRLVCGWLCPFGWIQDLLYKIPLFHKKKNLPGHKGLRWLRFGILLVFVILLPSLAVGVTGMGEPWFCKYICPSGTLFGGLPLTAVNEGLRAACGFLFQWKVFLLLAVLVLSIKYSRPFCKYICPLGAVYGCFNPISLYRLQVDSQKCIRCGKCQRACGADIPVWEQPNSIDCIRCGDCKAVCPTGAIVSSLDKWKNKRLNTESGIK
ncbi:MAG: 4Fe-4S binding protein [Negativibacillus sp.]